MMYRTLISVAMQDQIIEDLPITFQDKLAYERTSRARKWTEADNPITTNGFLAWHAAKRLGRLDMTFEEFCAEDGPVEDVTARMVDASSITGEDPTRPDR